MVLAEKVARRFLGHQYTTSYDARFVPPRWMVAAVEDGKMPAEVLNVWKYVVTQAGQRFNPKDGKSWAGATQHWRSKCKRMGIVIPKEYIEGGGGSGAAGRWRVTAGETIEEWVKEKLVTEGLHDDLRQTVHDVQLDIGHLHREVEKAQDTIDKHLKAMEAPKDRAGKNRQRWLDGAKRKHASYMKLLEEASTKLEKMVEASDKYDKATVLAVEFEKEAQFLMKMALRDLGDVQKVIDSLRKAEKRFVEGMDIPGGDFQYSAEQMERYRNASADKTGGLAEILDRAWGFLSKVWDVLVGAWQDFKDWTASIVGVTKKMNDVFAEAS